MVQARVGELSLQEDSFLVQAMNINNALGSPRINGTHMGK